MLGQEDKNFFFRQKRQKRFQQRRVRKFNDTHSIAGDRREGITFLILEREGEATSVFGGGAAPPGTASRRVSVVNPPTTLPSIDPNGPHLVTTPQAAAAAETVETRASLSEKKLNFLQEVEAKVSSKKEGHIFKPIWTLNEAKFASTGILSLLAKTLTVISEKEAEVTPPEDLIDLLSQTHEELVADTIIERREWQTDCYLDYKSKNTHAFLTGIPDKSTREERSAAIRGTIAQQQKSHEIKGAKREKKVRMSHEAKNEKATLTTSLERPHTARSIMSNFSLKSDLSDDGRESTVTTDYDRLPAELRPNILHYRRETSMPKIQRTRMETMKSQTEEREKARQERAEKEMLIKEKLAKDRLAKKQAEDEKQMKKAANKLLTVSKLTKRPPTAGSKRGKIKSSQRPMTAKHLDDADGENNLAGLGDKGPKTVINFSVEETTEDKQDWLVHPSDTQDPESHTLRLWDKRLKELHRMREESEYMDKNRGADKPIMVKFYNDVQIRTLRNKHQRSTTVPLPAVFNKLPPSMKSFSTPVFNEATMIGEGVTVFVLTLPDGSGNCNYMSGRQAISQSRCDNPGPLIGSRGFYTLVFDDVEDTSLLAYFTPTGKACCYYQSGAIHMLSDNMGGCLYNEDGIITKKWGWPPPRLNLAVTICVYLNVHISLRCTNLSNMDLRVSTRGHNYKFSVGPLIEDLEQQIQRTENLAAGDIQSTLAFISRAAKSHSKYVGQDGVDSVEQRRERLTRGKASRVLLKDSAEHSLPNLLADSEKYSQQLDTFRKNIHAIVNNWMHHYCKAVGINIDTPLFSRPSSRAGLHSRGVSSRSRMVKSSMSYATGLSRPSSSTCQLRRTRSLTHPLSSRPSSRPISPPRPFNLLPAGGVEGELARSSSPLPSLRPVSPLDFIQPPPMNELHSKPFKVGRAKLQSKNPSKSAVSCPVKLQDIVELLLKYGARNSHGPWQSSALHLMLWKNLDSMPPCKCDKRKVPYISDLEYDIFLLSHVPREQLIIVCIVSSMKEGSCSCEPMIDATYTHQNRLRFSPCLQCSHDPFRLVKYDLVRARKGMTTQGPVGEKPLLKERHNASPGMFLMYMGGRLVYADYMFNGYSTSKRDFVKQVENCIQQGKRDQFLPYDFKFTRHTGTKILGSSAWAYPVPGFMQELVPFSPQSDSHTTSRNSTPVTRAQRNMPTIITECEGEESGTEDLTMSTASQFTLSQTTSQLKVSQTLISNA